MIDLKLQIASLLFSLIFGIILEIMIKINYKFIKQSHKLIQIILTFLVIIINTLIYFIGLKYINESYIHPYFILIIIVGCILEDFLAKKISNTFVKSKVKWYNDTRIGD